MKNFPGGLSGTAAFRGGNCSILVDSPQIMVFLQTNVTFPVDPHGLLERFLHLQWLYLIPLLVC